MIEGHAMSEIEPGDLVWAVLSDPAFQTAVGPSDRQAQIAEAAVTAMLVFIGLTSLVIDVVHEGAGHG